MATIINININGFGVSQTQSPDPSRTYTLLPGFSPVREMFGERKIKAKKKKKCTNGQVCGFSCISKTKVCTANMTAAQFKEHNEAKRAERREKAKAAKGGGGAEIKQAVGGNNTPAPLVSIDALSIAGADDNKSQKIAEAYLNGQVPIRPIIVRSTGTGLDESYEVLARQDEAKGHQLAKGKNKFYEMAPAVVVNDKNESQIKEQLSITQTIKREIPKTTAPESQPFDHLKPSKNRVNLFDIESVDATAKLTNSEKNTVEALAQNFLKVGNIDPIILTKTGSGLDERYAVASGRLEFAAVQRAKQINPNFEMFKGLLMDSSNEKNIVDQLAAIYGE